MRYQLQLPTYGLSDLLVVLLVFRLSFNAYTTNTTPRLPFAYHHRLDYF